MTNGAKLNRILLKLSGEVLSGGAQQPGCASLGRTRSGDAEPLAQEARGNLAFGATLELDRCAATLLQEPASGPHRLLDRLDQEHRAQGIFTHSTGILTDCMTPLGTRGRTARAAFAGIGGGC